MDEQTFQAELTAPRQCSALSKSRSRPTIGPDISAGCVAQFLGERFGTARQHELWLSLASDDDHLSASRGRGYRDGLMFGGEGWVTT